MEFFKLLRPSQTLIKLSTDLPRGYVLIHYTGWEHGKLIFGAEMSYQYKGDSNFISAELKGSRGWQYFFVCNDI